MQSTLIFRSSDVNIVAHNSPKHVRVDVSITQKTGRPQPWKFEV